jgi:hypothetical protein
VADDVERVREPMSSDDAAGILLRSRAACAGCARSARSRPGARTGSAGRLNGSRAVAGLDLGGARVPVGRAPGRPNELVPRTRR